MLTMLCRVVAVVLVVHCSASTSQGSGVFLPGRLIQPTGSGSFLSGTLFQSGSKYPSSRPPTETRPYETVPEFQSSVEYSYPGAAGQPQFYWHQVKLNPRHPSSADRGNFREVTSPDSVNAHKSTLGFHSQSPSATDSMNAHKSAFSFSSGSPAERGTTNAHKPTFQKFQSLKLNNSETQLNSRGLTSQTRSPLSKLRPTESDGEETNREQQSKRSKNSEDDLYCGGASDLGFCTLSPDDDDLPELLNNIDDDVSEGLKTRQSKSLDNLLRKCAYVKDIFADVLAPSIHDLQVLEDAQMKNSSVPWSWKSYQHNTKKLCSSQLRIVSPSFAKDTKGDWLRIVQTREVHQKVVINMCHLPGTPCPGVSDCGSKSICVQQYSFYQLLAGDPELTHCPKLRIFKFPSGCSCHVAAP